MNFLVPEPVDQTPPECAKLRKQILGPAFSGAHRYTVDKIQK